MNAEHRDLMASMSTFDIENVKDEDQRLQLKDAAKALLRRIETPFEMIWDHVWSYVGWFSPGCGGHTSLT